jgi:hypothetical protein
MPAKQSDPVIDELREVRHRISERFDHDPARLVAYYMKLQEEYRERLLHLPSLPKQQDDPSAA